MDKINPSFFKELEVVVAEIKANTNFKKSKSKIKPDVYSKLINDFEEVKTHNRQKIASLLEQEKEYSPLFCPISLFGTLDYGRLEIAHTKTLGWLISPEKEHCFKYEFTKIFFNIYGIFLPPEDDLESFEVETEKYLNNGADVFGRADIFIAFKHKGKITNILIEAKIDSQLTTTQFEKYRSYLSTLTTSINHFGILTLNSDLDLYENFDCKAVGYLELYKEFTKKMGDVKDEKGFEFLRLYLSGVAKDLLDIPYMNQKQTADGLIPYNIIKILG